MADAISAADATTWIAFGAMLAAFFAAGEAFRNRRLSSRMYDIAVREQGRTETPLEVYLADSRILHVPAERRRVYVFELVITNKSALANSIKQLSLSLEYEQDKRPESSLTIQHRPAAFDQPVAELHSVFVVPRGIAAGEAVSGTALFSIADNMLDNDTIEMYTVEVVDAHDRAAQCEAVLLREREL